MFNNKLDKKISNNNTNDDFIENIRDLFSILDYEPVLIKSGECKLQLSAEISFVSQKHDSNEICIMFTRSTPEEIIIGSETEEVAEK